MGFLDRLFGRPERRQYEYDQRQADYGTGYGAPQQRQRYPYAQGKQLSPDEQAIERYKYLLRTAPPDQIEQAHAEAFARLSPEQRSQVLAELSAELPPGERPASSDPQTLARAATRAEVRNPGTLERSFGRTGGMGGGMGMGGMLAGGLLAGVAGAFIGTAVADALFDNGPGDGGLFETGDGGDAEAAADTQDAGYDGGGNDGGGYDGGGYDAGGSDFGGFDGGF